MTIKELATLATKAINSTPKNPRVVIIMPGDRQGETQALCEGGPVGRVINETDAGTWVSFDAVDLLAYCEAMGKNDLPPIQSSDAPESAANSGV